MTNNDKRIVNTERRLQWVPVAKIRISPRAQRQHNSPSSKAKIDRIATNLDPDLLGNPLLSYNKDQDLYWCIDGAHRVLGLKKLGWDEDGQQIQCWVYDDLPEHEQADKMLNHNDVKPVAGMDKFHIAIVAKRETESDIDRIVRAAGLKVGTDAEAIGCVGTLLKTYEESGPRGLATTIRIIRDAYGTAGFSAKIVEGVGKFVTNYEAAFQEERAVKQLATMHGGVNGLKNRAHKIREQHGVSLGIGVAAATVERYNAGLRPKSQLNGWWSTFNGGGETA